MNSERAKSTQTKVTWMRIVLYRHVLYIAYFFKASVKEKQKTKNNKSIEQHNDDKTIWIICMLCHSFERMYGSGKVV